MNAEDPPPVVVELSADEALVLFELLQRFNETEVLSIADKAEERALWNVCSLLEKQLVEPFAADYSSLLASARARLRDISD